MLKTTTSDKFTMKYDEGICQVIYLTDNIDVNLAKDIVANRKLLSNNKKVPCIIYGGLLISISKEARLYFKSTESTDDIVSCAFVINSNLMKFVLSLFLNVNPTILPFPIKIFNSKEEATKWLKTFID